MSDIHDIFLVTAPGLEETLAEEAAAAGFDAPRAVPGGVETRGPWSEVWRANLALRGATRVLVRIGGFRAMHLAQLDKRARRFPWAETLRPDLPLKVEATCRGSRIYHAKAAAQRVERALAEELGATISDEAALRLMVRIEDDFCSFSLDTSGAPLHRRGHKQQVNKAPMRETLAALFLRQCGYTGTEPVYDPMCGSGTFVIEAAEIALGLAPGRARGFAFETLASFDAAAFAALRDAAPVPATAELPLFHGSDRDAGAVVMSQANAERAGVSEVTRFERRALSEVAPPEGAPGLMIVNPPYGGRIGNRKLLFGLYATLGKVFSERFAGWRLGLVTNDGGLAKATGLALASGPVVDHGGQKVRLYQAGRAG